MKRPGSSLVRCLSILLIAGAPASSIAQPEWPSIAEEMREHWRTHEHAFESLKDRMHREAFVKIEATGASQVLGTQEVDGQLEHEVIEDSLSWIDAMDSLRIGSVFNMRGAYYFSYAEPIVAGDVQFRVTFLNGRFEGLPECSSSYAVADCGTCYNTLSDEWSVNYDWTPVGFTKRVMAGQDRPDARTILSKLRDAKDACRADGRSRMEAADRDDEMDVE